MSAHPTQQGCGEAHACEEEDSDQRMHGFRLFLSRLQVGKHGTGSNRCSVHSARRWHGFLAGRRDRSPTAQRSGPAAAQACAQFGDLVIFQEKNLRDYLEGIGDFECRPVWRPPEMMPAQEHAIAKEVIQAWGRHEGRPPRAPQELHGTLGSAVVTEAGARGYSDAMTCLAGPEAILGVDEIEKQGFIKSTERAPRRKVKE